MVKTTKHIKNRLEASGSMSKKDIMLGNFLGGLAWGLGTVVGASVVVAILGWILQALGVFDPIIQFFNRGVGNFV